MINKYTNKQRGLLAVIMAMVMVFAGAAFIAAEVDAADDTNIYVGGIGADDATGDGTTSKPYATLNKAVSVVTGSKTIVLQSDVKWNDASEYVDKAITIDGKKFKIILENLMVVTVNGTFKIKDATIVTDNSDYQIEARESDYGDSAAANGTKIVLENCVYTSINTPVDPRAIYIGNGSAEFVNTDFSNKKVTISYEATSITFTKCSNVYLNPGKAIKFGTDVNTDSETEFKSIKIGNSVNLNGNSYKFDNIFVKENSGSITNGMIAGDFSVYEQDVNDTKTAIINFNDASTEKLTGINNFAKGITVTGKVVLDNNASIALSEGAIIDATVTSTDGSSATFDDVKASTGGVTITQGSIVIGGAITTDVGKITITSGTAKINVKEVPSNISFEVNTGATLVVPEDIKMNDAAITVKGGTVMLYSNAKVTYESGTVAVAPGVEATKVGGIAFTPKSTTSLEDNFGMKNTLEYDYVVQTKAFLADNLTIPEGVTLTIKGEFDLCGYELIVLGTLVVEKKGVIESGTITLGETGMIQNEGTIGYKTTVTVKDQKTLAATVTMKGVTGIGFSLTKEVTGTGSDAVVTYTLTVSGEAVEKVDGATLSINGAYITDLVVKDVVVAATDVIVLKDGTVSVGTKGKITISDSGDPDTFGVVMKNGSEIVIDGEISDVNADIYMYNGTTAYINGTANDVTFKTKAGIYETYATGGVRNNPDTGVVTGTSDASVTIGNLNGITIEITSKSFTKENASGDDVPYTEQMMNVYGTAAFADKDKDKDGNESVGNPSGDITVVGNVYVPAGQELNLAEDMTLSDGTITTAGLLKMVNADPITNYSGAFYTIEVPKETAGKDVISYYTNFDDAYTNIATADNMTIKVRGGYIFSKEYTIAADQTINLADDDTKEYSISKDGKITVEAEGSILPATGSFDDIKGLLIVMDGGSCKPAADAYEVSSKDADGNMTYTSAELAIANAQAGETIYITGTVTFEDETTIPEGVTVEISTGSTINAEKDLEIEGELINKGTVNVGTTDAPADLTVIGEVDTTEGIVNVKGEATVTGEVIGTMSATKINAASYIDEADTVYSSVASAVAASAAMDIPAPVNVTGKVSESSDVVLAEGQKLIIDGEVVLKSVRLDVGSNLTVNGKLTADVIAATGVMDTTGALADSVISVKEIEDVEFDVKKNDAKNTITMYMDVITSGDMNGTTTVTAGSVQLDAAVEVSKTNVMKVSEGATLVVMENITAGSGNSKYFSNAGTLVINDDNVTLNGLNLGGTVDVAEKKALTISNVTVSGTLTTGEDASVTVADGKYMYVGSKPTTLGAAGTVNADVAFGNNAYIVVFEGSTFTNTDADVKMDSTAYTINDIAFATVYVAEGNSAVLVKIIDPLVIKLEDLDVKFTDTDEDGVWDDTEGYTIDWKSGSTGANTAAVGQYDTVNAKIGYSSVDVTISVGPGLIVYIDDIKDTDGKESLTIGTHTVTVYIEKGYEGTPAITLNGVAVTDGKLVITTDMMDLEQNLLSVTGATVMQDQPVVIQPSDSEKDGMELTDILLIVLVVLIVIMAIIVALRMMRS